VNKHRIWKALINISSIAGKCLLQNSFSFSQKRTTTKQFKANNFIMLFKGWMQMGPICFFIQYHFNSLHFLLLYYFFKLCANLELSN